MTLRGMRMTAVALAAVSVAAVVIAVRTPAPRALGRLAAAHPLLVDAADAAPAPELAGITAWHNATPTSLAALRGRGEVVLIDFWTYSCINCRRSLAFLRRLHAAYGDRGLTIVGVHAPEFDFEKIPDNVTRAIAELDVTWPVAEDPHKQTWDAFGNQYWPAKHFIDANGRLRGVHIGEGGDDDVEQAVRALLTEAGAAPGPSLGAAEPVGERPAVVGDRVTPEVYLGAERARSSTPVGLTGRWRRAAEYVAPLEAGARLTVAVRARDVYLLAAPERGAAPGRLEIRVGDGPVPPGLRGRDVVADAAGRTFVVVDDDDLRHVLTGPSVADHAISVVAVGSGARLFTFSFGG
ncbi:MAG TPA: redoxin family protein [Mycobacteriales bacterium]|nr:redoxin family protein [Mycobacteriales bacterium]